MGLEPLAIDPDHAVAAEVKRLAMALCDDALRQLELARQGVDREEAIHETRKRFKELRALFRLVETTRMRRRARPARRLIRDAGQSLSGTRDADVLLETFEKLTKRYGSALDPSAGLRASMMAVAAAEPLDATVASHIAGRVRNEVALWPPEAETRDIVRAFARGYRAAREAMTAALRTRSAPDFHEWRKREKDHWYHTRMLGRMLPVGLREPPLHALSRLLGDHHDLVLVIEGASGRGNGDAAAVVNLVTFARQRMRELEHEAAIAGMDLLGRPAADFERDVAAVAEAAAGAGPGRPAGG